MHVKLDTGMGRLGTRDPDEATPRRRARGGGATGVELAGLMTHFATADEPGDAFFGEQLERFRAWARAAARRPSRARCSTRPTAPRRCATRRAHFDLVRPGIAIYGMDPFGEDPAAHGLEPALELRSYVAAGQADAPRARASGYGRRFIAERTRADRDRPDRLRRRLAPRR